MIRPAKTSDIKSIRKIIDLYTLERRLLTQETVPLYEDVQEFFVAEDKDELIGFCWTKVHGAHTHSHTGGDDDHGHDALGEIYVLAVNPDYKGQGVGRDLTITGLNYLKYQGLNNVMLYVGVENKPALNLYKSLGFNEFGSDVMYRVKDKL